MAGNLHDRTIICYNKSSYYVYTKEIEKNFGPYLCSDYGMISIYLGKILLLS